MAKPKVFATHRLFDPARKILEEHCDVEYWENPGRPTREEVLRRVANKEGLICLLTEKVNDELLQAAPKLKIAANVAVGFDNIDVAACTRRGVVGIGEDGGGVRCGDRTRRARRPLIAAHHATPPPIGFSTASRSLILIFTIWVPSR